MGNIKCYSSVTVTDYSDSLIKSVIVWYYLSTSSTTQSGGSWSTTPPPASDNKYFWQKTVTTYEDGSTDESKPVCISGGKGTGVASIIPEYYLSTSKTSQVGSSWSTTPPTWSTGKYIWTRSKITYKDPASIVYTTPICDSSWEAVNIVDGKLTTLTNTVSGVSSKVDATAKSITDKIWQTDKINVTNSAGATVSKSIKDILVDNTKDINGINSKVSAVETKVDTKADGTTVTELSELVTQNKQDAEGFKQTVKNTYATKTDVDNKYATKQSFTEVSQKADSIEQTASTNTGDISTLKQTATDVTTRLSNAEGDIANIEAEASSFKVEVSKNHPTKDDMNTAISDASEATTATINVRADLIEQNVADLNGSLNTITQTVTTNTTNITSNSDMLVDIQKSNADFKDYVGESFYTKKETADLVTSTVGTIKEETKELVTSEVQQDSEQWKLLFKELGTYTGTDVANVETSVTINKNGLSIGSSAQSGYTNTMKPDKFECTYYDGSTDTTVFKLDKYTCYTDRIHAPNGADFDTIKIKPRTVNNVGSIAFVASGGTS